MTVHPICIQPNRDIVFQQDKNGDDMALVRLENPIVIEDTTVSCFFAHSKWSAPDFKLLKEIENGTEEVSMQLALSRKNSYWNLVKNSLKRCSN